MIKLFTKEYKVGPDVEYRIFNEYMTWALFSLYCYDNFPKEDIDEYIRTLEYHMVFGRGFIKFREFNQDIHTKQCE